eukprot:3271868-Ditylum_brightwellii.AAC.1
MTNCMLTSRLAPIPFFVKEKKIKLSHVYYQIYKLYTNPRNEKSVVYLLTLGIYKVVTPEEWLQLMDENKQIIKGQDITDLDAAYTLVKSLLQGDALKIFQNKEESHKIKDSPAFTAFLAVVTKHEFLTKACKTQKKCIQNACKPLMMCSTA